MKDLLQFEDSLKRRITASDLPMSTALGVLGLNGLTAYFALLELGQPKAGETVAVSTAAGAVGSCVGQIARIKGCRTIGIAGGPQKAALCRDAFGYDVAIDYRAGDLEATIAAACPDGIEHAPGAIAGLYRGENLGKRLIRIAAG